MKFPSFQSVSIATLTFAFLSACSGASSPTTPAQPGAGNQSFIRHDALTEKRLADLSRSLMSASLRNDQVVLAATTSKTVRFQDSDCRPLTEAQTAAYVDPAITGQARRLAILHMLAEPACGRSNVEGIDRVPYSNTREGLAEVQEEYTDWTLDGDGTYSDSSGDEIVASNPGPDTASTGTVYKYNSNTGYSAVSGMFQIPECGWINNVAAKNTPFILSGGTPVSGSYIDAGAAWNNPSQTVQLYYQDNDLNTKPLGGNYKYPCTLAGGNAVYLKMTLGIITNKTATVAPQFYMLAVSVNADGSAGPYPNSHIGPLSVNRSWSISCAACQMKREFNIAQKNGTNANSGTVFAMDDAFQSGTPIQETRTPLEPYVNFSVGNYSGRSYTSAGYLWLRSNPIIMPASLPANLKLLTFLGSNNGTESPGMILSNCQTAPKTDCQAAPGAAQP
jgi:hypothetical protein